MKRLALLLAAALAVPAAAQAPASPDRIAAAVKASGFQGVYAVGNGAGRIAGGSLGAGAPRAPFVYEDVFPWGPVTQQVVATIALGEVDDGKLPLASRPGEPGVRDLLARGDTAALAQRISQAERLPLPGAYVRRISSQTGMAALFEGSADRRVDANWPGSPDPAERAMIGQQGAAGGLVGTAEDLLAFDRALLGGFLLTDARRDDLWRSGVAGQRLTTMSLPGCTRPVRMVVLQGGQGRFQVANVLLPDQGAALVMLSNRPIPADLSAIAAAVACP